MKTRTLFLWIVYVAVVAAYVAVVAAVVLTHDSAPAQTTAYFQFQKFCQGAGKVATTSAAVCSPGTTIWRCE